jgi:DNA-binding NarL/FixJ family response regulator
MEPLTPDPAARPLKVLVVDADRRVRQSLCGLIDVADGMEMTCSAADPAGALAELAEHPVDLVLLDPRLPEFDAGKALVGAIRRDWPQTRIVALYWPEEHQNGEAHAITVVPSTVQPDSLVDLLRASASGAVPDGAAPLS